jgi:peroxiredoxin
MGTLGPFTQMLLNFLSAVLAAGSGGVLPGRAKFAGKTLGPRDAYGQAEPSGAVTETSKENVMPLLNPGDPFPRLTISTTDGQTATIPDALAESFGVVLFYRGAWCPYCNAQLRAFERAGKELADTGIKIAALSVDDKETTAALVAKHKLTFPVGYGADAPAIASLTGAFVNPDPVYLQSTGFVLDRAGKVVVSVYSSGAIGRLVPDDVAGLVRYLREHAPATA